MNTADQYRKTYSRLTAMQREDKDDGVADLLRRDLRMLWDAMTVAERSQLLGPACLDRPKHKVKRDGVPLTAREFKHRSHWARSVGGGKGGDDPSQQSGVRTMEGG